MRNFFLPLFAFIPLLVQSNLFAQSLPANVTPQMVQQAKSMSPTQQKALAKELGIDMPSNQGADLPTNSYEQNNDRFEDFSDESTLDNENEDVLAPDYGTNRINDRFGLSIFRNRVSTFSPIDNLPVPDNYKLGAGDQLIIKLLGTENIQLSPTISRDGSIFIDQIGDIVLSGLLFDDAVKLIKQRIESTLIGVQVFVTMGRIKTINVFISGEVVKPGMYALSALTSVTQSLYQAGGITEIGSLRNIQVMRNGELINKFDAYDLLIYGNSTNDIRLRSGDVLFVPSYEGVVVISGNVKRQSTFEIKQSDTFADLLKWAGGYNLKANPEFGLRISSDGIGSLANTKTLDFNDPVNLAIELKRNDKFFIPAVGDSIFNSITVSGAVTRPGMMGWYDGMRLSDVFSDINEDFIPLEVDLDFGFIERFDLDTMMWVIIPFTPLDVFLNQSTTDNLILNENDRVIILFDDLRRMNQIASSVTKLRAQSSNEQLSQVVTISGAVKFPGEYPIFKDSTLADLFIAAGGFKDDALLGSIEISRINLVDDGVVVPSIIEISALNNFNESISFELQSRDRINVRTVSELNITDTISLGGEVKYPGIYPLNKGDTLSSIIERAGGLLDSAFPQGAFLQRKTTMAAQRQANTKLAKTIRSSYASSLLTSEKVSNTFGEINAVAEILENSPNDGRVIIDLEAALNGDRDSNILLDKGDSLVIPRIINTVSVIGEVNSSTSNIYNPSLGVDDYIALAGGFSPRADQDDIYIIQANGEVTPLTKSFFGFGLSKYKLQQGDTIVVPIAADYQDKLGLLTQVTQLFYQSLVSLAALDRITE
jgi:polysaccharide export outer membrane protein